jgi:hypothetical protein
MVIVIWFFDNSDNLTDEVRNVGPVHPEGIQG